MNKPGFLICAPLQGADTSNGVHALLHLAKTIEKLGRSAYVCEIFGKDDERVCTDDLNTLMPKDATTKAEIDTVIRKAEKFGVKMFGDFTRDTIDASYVLYPECVLGNPLGAKHVVRYFGNRDGVLKNGRKVAIGATDFILAHSKVMHPEAQHVCFFSLPNPLFNPDNTEAPQRRGLDITYVGKGALYGFEGKIDGTFAITRSQPATKEELAVLLRNCRFFYTADACSNLNHEALRCGAIPVLVHNGPWTDADLDSFEPGAWPRATFGDIMDGNALHEFELARDQYLKRVYECEQRWEPSVAEMIEKVDRHFAVQEQPSETGRSRTGHRGVIRSEKSAATSVSALSRKDRKRWIGNSVRTGQEPGHRC